MKTLRVK